MYKLIIDTSTKVLYVCIVLNDKVLYEKYNEGRNDHSKNIMNFIIEGLNICNIKITDLDSIICGIGPGSYTGVRISVTLAKILSCNSSVKLYKISSLFLISSGYEGNIISYIDARRGNSFNLVYNNDKIFKEDDLRETSIVLDEYKDFFIVNEDNIKVNPLKVIKKAILEEKPHVLEPSYLRLTEAERNKND